MKSLMTSFLAGVFAVAASVATAGVIELKPASPQPSGLKQGLKMQFRTGPDIRPRSLSEANGKLSSSAKVTAISNLQWPDKGKGAKMFGSSAYEHIVARFSGYIKFDKAGEYKLEWYANDGLQVWISGQQVGRLDGINPCSSAGRPKVRVPSPGWYEFKAFYYQKEGTACYESEWTPPGGKRGLIPNSAFGYK